MAFVGRQPIFSQAQSVYAYELLFRSGSTTNANTAGQGDAVTTTVMNNSLSVIGLDTLTGGKLAFVNMTRTLLLRGDYKVLPKDVTVIELLEDIVPDPEVIEACRELKSAGYMLALDDLVSSDGYEPLLDLADIVKVDFMGTDHAKREQLAKKLAGHNTRLLAEKVETHDEFAQALQHGYELFQGYFFSKPEIVAVKDVPGMNQNYLRMLVEINRPDIDFDQLEKIVKTDLSLSSKLLRYLNSASMGVRNKITSIKQALVMLGLKPLKRWATLIFMANMGKDKPEELMVTSLVRAKFCESMAKQAGLSEREFDLFMMGMMSVLDVMMGRPIDELLGPMPLEQDVKATLSGQPTKLSGVFDLAVACERVNRPRVIKLAEQSGIDLQDVDQAYRDSITWADGVMAA